MLFAASEVASDSDKGVSDKGVSVQYVNVTQGSPAIFPCYFFKAVEWRCGDDKSLIYAAGKIRRLFAANYSHESGGGWHNLTMKATPLHATKCTCFDADDGDAIKRYETAVVTGNVQCVFSSLYYLHVSTYQIYMYIQLICAFRELI